MSLFKKKLLQNYNPFKPINDNRILYLSDKAFFNGSFIRELIGLTMTKKFKNNSYFELLIQKTDKDLDYVISKFKYCIPVNAIDIDSLHIADTCKVKVSDHTLHQLNIKSDTYKQVLVNNKYTGLLFEDIETKLCYLAFNIEVN